MGAHVYMRGRPAAAGFVMEGFWHGQPCCALMCAVLCLLCLQIHLTKEPLVEEYSVAAQVGLAIVFYNGEILPVL